MGNLSNQIANIATQVGDLAALVQMFLNSQGQDIDINQITNQINQAVADAIANVMSQLEGLDVTILRSDIDNVILKGLSKALLDAGLAHSEIEAITSKYIQHGTAELRFRGVQSGCVVTKSTTATRNLNLAAGTLFGDRQLLTVSEQINGTSIHNNPGSTAQVCEVYVIDNGNGVLDFRTTPFGEVTPAEGWQLYRVTVPAGNTEANDEYLASVTLTDIRKLEPNYPVILTAEPFVYAALPYAMPDADYGVFLEIVNQSGLAWDAGDVYVKDKAKNGFKIATNGLCSRLEIRWTAIIKKGVGVIA
jgi:hypothetical protein